MAFLSMKMSKTCLVKVHSATVHIDFEQMKWLDELEGEIGLTVQ